MNPTTADSLSRSRACGALVQGVFLEILRKKDIYVAAMLLVVFLGFIGAARLIGIDNPATGTLLLNLGLTLAVTIAQVLTLLVSLRQMPDELEQRTLYPLLARPIGRAEVLFSKWLGCTLAGLGVFILLAVPVWIMTPRLDTYYTSTLLQLLLLGALSLGLVAALAQFFSILLPKMVALVVSTALYFGGGALTQFLDRTLELPGLVIWLLSSLRPNFNRLNLVVRYTDGIPPLHAADFLLLIVYGGIWTAVLLFAGCTLFQKRSI